MAHKENIPMSEIRGWSDEDLASKLSETRRRLFTLRTQAVTDKVEDVSLFGVLRKNAARLMTERGRRHEEKNAASA